MKILLLNFAIVVFVNAAAVYPKHEVLFKYKADFRTGVIDSEIPGSQFVLEADLNAQYYGDSRLGVLYFSNTKVSVHNGKLPMEGDQENENFLPIVRTAADFENPFLIGGQEDENKIFTSKNEPNWVVNVKKSVASLFKFDWDTFEKNSKESSSHSFTVEEDSLYGKCDVAYTMTPKEENWIVNKKLNPKDCSLFNKRDSTMGLNFCENGFNDDDDYLTENIRTYEITESHRNDYFTRVFSKIEAKGKILIFPTSENGDLKYTNVKQTVEFIRKKPVKKFRFGKMVSHSTELSFDEYDEMEYLEATYTEDMLDTETGIDANEKNCKILIEAFSTNVTESSLYNFIIKKFRYYKTDDFENCVNKFDTENDATLLQMFYKILPMIGTTASVNYIKNVLKTHKLEPSISSSMIQFLPFHVLVPTEEMLEDLKEFISSDFKLNPSVKYDAILAYSTLIHRTFQYSPKSSELDEYINTYYKNLKTADSYSDQLIWLQGLTNIEIGSVWKLLIPIIRGDQILDLQYDHYLSIHAILGAHNLVEWYHDEFFDVLWPIITDRTLNSHFRVIAMKVYINGCETKRDFSELFWYMQTETNKEVYNYFRTTVKSMGKSTNHCKSPIITYAKQLEDHMRNFGAYSDTYCETRDYYDENTRIGGKFVTEVFASEKRNFVSLNAGLDVYAMHKAINLVSVYQATFSFNVSYPDKTEKVLIDTIFQINSKIVFTNITINSNSKKLRTPSFYTDMFLKNNAYNFYYLINLLNMNKVIPSDIGLPIVFNTKMPILTNIEYENEEKGKKHSISFKFQQDLFGSHSITTYNPFLNVFHGIMDQISYKINLPLALETNENGFKIKLNDYQGENQILFENQMNSYVFLSHSTDISLLPELCNNCTNRLPRDDGNFEEIKSTFLSEIGLDYKQKISKCSDNTDPIKVMAIFGDSPDMLDVFHNSLNYYYLVSVFDDIYSQSSDIFSCNRKIEISSNELYSFEELSASVNGNDKFSININALDAPRTIRWEGAFSKENCTNSRDFHTKGTFSRIVEGQPIMNLCYEHKKKINNDRTYQGEFLWSENVSFNKECVQDDVIFKVNYERKKSEDQENALTNGYTYKNCESNSEYLSISPTLSTACVTDHLSLRRYSLNIEYENLPEKYRNIFAYVSRWFKENSEGEPKYQTSTSMDQNKISFEFISPMNDGNNNDVIVQSPWESYKIKIDKYVAEAIPISLWDGVTYMMYLTNCVVKLNDDIDVNDVDIISTIPEKNKWVKLTGKTTSSNQTLEIAVQTIDDTHLEVKITVNYHSLIVRLDENEKSDFSYDMDDFFLDSMSNDNEMEIQMFKIDNTFVFYSYHFYTYLIYDGKYVKTRYFDDKDGICQREKDDEDDEEEDDEEKEKKEKENDKEKNDEQEDEKEEDEEEDDVPYFFH